MSALWIVLGVFFFNVLVILTIAKAGKYLATEPKRELKYDPLAIDDDVYPHRASKYNPLTQEHDVNIPHYPGTTPESRQHMYDVLTGAKPPGPGDRLVTIEGAKIEKVLEEAGAPRRGSVDLRHEPLRTDNDIWIPVRSRRPTDS